MTKKDFIAIAKIISESTMQDGELPTTLHKENLVNQLGNYFGTVNIKFDYSKFVTACNKEVR